MNNHIFAEHRFTGLYALVSFPEMDYPGEIHKLALTLGDFFTQVAPIMIMTGDSRPYIQCAEILKQPFMPDVVIEEFKELEKWKSESASCKLADKMLSKINPETAGLIVITDKEHTLTMSELIHNKGRYNLAVPRGQALGINRHGSRVRISPNEIALWVSIYS